MKNFYQRNRVDINLFQQFKEFILAYNENKTFQLEGALNLATFNLDNAGFMFFDFIEIEEKFVEPTEKKKGDDLINWMGSISCSLAQTNFDKCVDKLYKSKKQSHMGCYQYTKNLLNLNENDFLEQFKRQRTDVLD